MSSSYGSQRSGWGLAKWASRPSAFALSGISADARDYGMRCQQWPDGHRQGCRFTSSTRRRWGCDASLQRAAREGARHFYQLRQQRRAPAAEAATTAPLASIAAEFGTAGIAAPLHDRSEYGLGTAGHAAPSPYDAAFKLGTAGNAAPSHNRNTSGLGAAGHAAPSPHDIALELGTAGNAAPSHNRNACVLGTAGDAAPSQHGNALELGTAGNAAPSHNRHAFGGLGVGTEGGDGPAAPLEGCHPPSPPHLVASGWGRGFGMERKRAVATRQAQAVRACSRLPPDELPRTQSGACGCSV